LDGEISAVVRFRGQKSETSDEGETIVFPNQMLIGVRAVYVFRSPLALGGGRRFAGLARGLAPIPGEWTSPGYVGCLGWKCAPPIRMIRAKKLSIRTPLVETLKAGGLLLDSGMGGLRETVKMTVIVEATDGYRAVFSLAELDPELTDRIILLADTKDGQPLPPHEGPRTARSGKHMRRSTGRVLPFSFQGLLIASLLYSLPFAVQPFTAAISTVDRGTGRSGPCLGYYLLLLFC